MAPRGDPAAHYPLLIASRIRVWIDWRELPLSRRANIRARKHAIGTYLSPRAEDPRAIAWIQAQAQRYGVLRWSRSGWTKELAGAVFLLRHGKWVRNPIRI